MARPGLYTPNGKIASVGIRIERGWNLHGLAINFAGDLTSFGLIDPCGVKGAQMDKVSNWACPSRSEFINRWLSAYEEWFSRTVNRK
ncbi:lipoyl protein ligase domain-containing protein, partial [Escherichia coli]